MIRRIEEKKVLNGLCISLIAAEGQLKVFGFEVSQGDHAVSVSETLTLPLPGFAASSTTVKKSSKGDQESNKHIDTLALGDNYLALAGNHQQDGKGFELISMFVHGY